MNKHTKENWKKKFDRQNRIVEFVFLSLIISLGVFCILFLSLMSFNIIKGLIPQEDPLPGLGMEQPVANVSMADDFFLTTEEKVEKEIRRQAKEYGVDEDVAVRIAICESTLNPEARNPNSSAVGVYQWLSGTWEYIGATKPRTDYEENIRQFMLHYPKNPQWWVCK